MMAGGHAGGRRVAVTGQGGDAAGDVGLTSQGRAVSGFWRTALVPGRFWGEGLRHTRELDAWREYGGNTAHLPDAKLRAVRGWEDPSAVDLRGG